jgi:hypothetical protein
MKSENMGDKNFMQVTILLTRYGYILLFGLHLGLHIGYISFQVTFQVAIHGYKIGYNSGYNLRIEAGDGDRDDARFLPIFRGALARVLAVLREHPC